MQHNGATGSHEETVCALFQGILTQLMFFPLTGCVLNVDFPPLSFAPLHHFLHIGALPGRFDCMPSLCFWF